MPSRGVRNRYFRFIINNLSGGLNLRDAPSELGVDESPDCMNVTMDERGGASKRLGYTKTNASQFNTTKFDNLFYSPTLQILIAQQQRRLAKSTDGGATWTELTSSVPTTPAFTDSDRVGFCEFLGKIVIAHPGATDGGIYTYTSGTAISAKVTNSPKASMCATWQNRLFTAGDPAAPTAVTNCDAGVLTYTTLGTTYNTLAYRTKDDSPVTAIGGGQGVDFAGRSGLLVWKEESHFRMNNSLTLAYDAISLTYGAANPLAIATSGGVTSAISKNGIVSTSDTQTSLVSVKLEPLFRPSQLALAYTSNMCAGVYRNRIVFSLTRVGSTINNMTLEYQPQLGWIVPHDFGMSAYATYGKQDTKLIGCSTSAGYTYAMFNGTTDDGATITSRYQTRWVAPFQGGDLFRLHRVRIFGRGSFTMYARYDYSRSQGDLFPLDLTVTNVGRYGSSGPGSIYNSGVVYGPAPYEGQQDVFPSKKCSAVSFVFVDTETNAVIGPPLLGDGVQDAAGSSAIYEIQARIWPLEGV